VTEVSATLRVLVVEDNFLAAEAAVLLLEDLGHEVVGPTPSIAEALARVEERPIDVALLDVDVRGQVVTPVAERLRELGCPVIFITGFADDALPSCCLGAPVLRKPFEEWSLLAALRSAVLKDA
jgi:CheY-like chemotaxis protein